MTLLILGAGASGMMAALAAAQNPDCQVVLLERQTRVGRKLLATGNGRCNLTNVHACPHFYHGQDPQFPAAALSRLNPQQTLDFFRALGLVTVTEPSGKVYPFSDQANSVVDVLRFALERPNIHLHTGCEVQKIWKNRQGYLLKTTLGDFVGDALIVAAGGCAGGKLGGTTAGYDLLKPLGHKATACHPCLVQLTCTDTALRALKGVRADASVVLTQAGTVLAESAGEVQFTDFGVSGPAIFEISRAAATANPPAELRLDLVRPLSEAALTAYLQEKCRQFPQQTAENLLTGLLHNRLGRVVVQSCGVGLESPLSCLGGDQLAQIAAQCKAFCLTCTGTLDFDHAQVTAGGLQTAQFDPQTLESRLLPGLYACGEVLDVDGDCGGFNLQWAWSSGYVAGLTASGNEVQP